MHAFLIIIDFFITDNSDAEMSAIKSFYLSPGCICDFHREKAWERWVKNKKHSLTDIEAATLLDLLRECANTPVNVVHGKEPLDHIFKLALNRLMASEKNFSVLTVVKFTMATMS